MQQCVKIVFLQNLGDVKNEVFENKLHFLFFLFFMLENRNRKKRKWKRQKKPYKNRVFLRWSSKNVKNKKRIFAKIDWHYLCQEGTKNVHFRAHYLFWPKIFFGPKQCKAGITIKIGVSAEIAKKSKNDTFFGKKVFFDMVEKVGFTTCVFEKLCLSENTTFIVFFSKTQLVKDKNCMLKKTENLWKIVGCFERDKMVFFGFVFLMC